MRFLLLVVAVGSVHAPPASGQSRFLSASAVGHDGTPIPIEIYGSAPRVGGTDELTLNGAASPTSAGR